MKNVHLTLQGKGGVGKTLIASLIAQYLMSKNEPLLVIDADPVNSTLATFKNLNATTLPLIKEGGSTVSERNYDGLMTSIFDNDKHIVVDNGASSFLPLSNYILSNEAIEMIEEKGKKVFIHTVITGGQGHRDTIAGFIALARQMPENANIVVWINEYFGKISSKGLPFEKTKTYEEYKKRIFGMVILSKFPEDTFGADIDQMLRSKLTFSEVEASDEFEIMAKSRLMKVKKAVFEQLVLLF